METPWKVVAAFIGVFVAGAVFGGFFSLGMGTRWMALQPAAAPVAAPVVTPAPEATAPAAVAAPTAATTPAPTAKPSPAPAGPRNSLLQPPVSWTTPQLMRRYAERLRLTPEQKQKVMPLIQRAAEDYRRTQQTMFRETAFILQRLQKDLARELTPEQQERLHQLEEKQREAMQKMEAMKKPAGEAKKPGAGQKQRPKAAAPAPAAPEPSTSATQTPAGTETETVSTSRVP